LVNVRAIEPDISVFDKSARDDGMFARGDSNYNQEADILNKNFPSKFAELAQMILFATGLRISKGLDHGRICLPGVACTACRVLRTCVSAKQLSVIGFISFREQVPFARSVRAMVDGF
jgi:hypothetical protein